MKVCNYGLLAKSSFYNYETETLPTAPRGLPVFIIKVLFICSHITYSYLSTGMAELSHCERPHDLLSLKTYRKSLSTLEYMNDWIIFFRIKNPLILKFYYEIIKVYYMIMKYSTEYFKVTLTIPHRFYTKFLCFSLNLCTCNHAIWLVAAIWMELYVFSLDIIKHS